MSKRVENDEVELTVINRKMTDEERKYLSEFIANERRMKATEGMNGNDQGGGDAASKAGR
ncbi:MAG: hypothetical protein U0176_22235 [Bacteroidia bacterium]